MFLNLKRKEGILSFKVPLLYVVGAICISIIGIQLYNTQLKTNAQEAKQSVSQIDHCQSMTIMTRRHTLGLTKPLLLTDNFRESESLNPLKVTIQSYINQKKAQGELIDCSVYFKKLNNGEYITIDNEKYYSPGSIAKLIILIAILKQSEIDKNLLNKKFFVKQLYTESIVSFHIDDVTIGKQYSVKELLAFMIENSSNTATVMLETELNNTILRTIFQDLNLKVANASDREYTINAKGISKFLEILYNVTYLSDANSEYAINLLSKTHFTEGMLNSIPKDVVIAHKYGEQGDENSKLLHETAIIFAENGPYILTIMTRGVKMEPLPKIIKDISEMAYKTSYTGSI